MKLLYLPLVLILFSCQEIVVEPIEPLGKNIKSPETIQSYELLESQFDITSNHITVYITDEFTYSRSTNFYAHLQYQSYSSILYLGRYKEMNFIIENYGIDNLQSVLIYTQQGD